MEIKDAVKQLQEACEAKGLSVCLELWFHHSHNPEITEEQADEVLRQFGSEEIHVSRYTPSQSGTGESYQVHSHRERKLTVYFSLPWEEPTDV